jgi:hypothetical protein
MPFDPNKPATLGPLSSAEIRENFRALKDDQIVDAGWLSGFPISAFVLKSTPTVITAVHTFNPTTAGAPFTIGPNAQGQLVTGLNADTVDGQHANAFASATHNHDTVYIRKGTADTITAVHTFSPSTASAPFILGTNAQGQLVAGLNADTVDGQHANAFASANHNHDASYIRKGTADTITAVHTFNPSSVTAPFMIGTNAQGQLVVGLNADTVDGQHANAFAPTSHNHDATYVRKNTAETINAVHTFNPSSPGAPFILGSNAQGQLITGLNSDTVDGKHASEFAPSSHNHDTTYLRKETSDTITAVHTFNPSSVSAPFILGTNAQGQLITGLNADTVDGQHAEAFAPANHNHDASYVRKGTADTITAVHTFNPSSASAPFILGANAQGRLVTGLNADTVDGQHGDAFVRKSNADTITAVHTFNPSSAGAPFILGANAQGRLVTGLNADTVDGQHAEAFAPANHNHDTSYVRKETADTITAVHTFNPSNASAPFILGENAQGRLVTGLNADTVDGQHAEAFAPANHNHDALYVRKGTADTITAVHTFNPSSASAPFILGANAQGRLVTGLNADTVDGQHGDAFVRKSNADTITAVHTFNPSSAGAPFILGSNAQGRLVSGLNADMVDGYHATDFRRAMTTNITVTVGSGGDFSTINDAINYLVNNFLPPCYRTSSGTPRATIRILSGTTIAEKIVVDGIDLSWITIESVDNTVTVNGNAIQGTFIEGLNGARLPKINVYFTIQPAYYNSGISLSNGSWAYVFPNKGISVGNPGLNALYLTNGSILIGRQTVWINADPNNYTAVCEYSILIIPDAQISNSINPLKNLRVTDSIVIPSDFLSL